MERSRRPTSARRSTKQPSTRVRQEEQLSTNEGNNNNNNVEGETKKEELQCGICLESIEVQGILNSCQHLFCFTCIDHWSKTANTCPMCKARFKQLTKIELGKPEVKPKKFKIKDADQHPEYSDPESWVVWEDDDDDEIELPFPPFPLFASLFGFSMMPGPLSVSFSTSGLVNMRFFPAPSSSAFPIFPPLLPLLSSIFSGDDDDEDEDEFDVDIEEQPRRRPTTTSRSARTSRSRLSARGSARQPSTRSSRTSTSTSTATRSSSRPSTSSTRSSTSSTTSSDETPASGSTTSPSTTTTTTTTRTRTSETRVERNPARSRSRRNPY